MKAWNKVKCQARDMETIDILWNLKGEARPVTQNWQRIETKQPLWTNLEAYWLIWAQIVLGQDFLFQMQMILKQYLRKSGYSFHTLHDLTSRSGVVSNLLFEPQSWYISTLLIWVYYGVSSLASRWLEPELLLTSVGNGGNVSETSLHILETTKVLLTAERVRQGLPGSAQVCFRDICACIHWFLVYRLLNRFHFSK